MFDESHIDFDDIIASGDSHEALDDYVHGNERTRIKSELDEASNLINEIRKKLSEPPVKNAAPYDRDDLGLYVRRLKTLIDDLEHIIPRDDEKFRSERATAGELKAILPELEAAVEKHKA